MKNKFTAAQIRAIKETFVKCAKENKPMVNTTPEFAADYFVDELTRSEPEFSEGEVVAFRDKGGDTEYLAFHTETNYNWKGYRPLTFTEHGKHVRDLRDGTIKVAQRLREDVDTVGAAKALFAIAEAFDAAVKDE